MLRNSLWLWVSARFLTMAIALAALAASAPFRPAIAAVLGTEDFTTEGGAGEVFTSFHPTLAIALAVTGRGRSSPATGAPLLKGTSITPDDVGLSFTATQVTDANFKDFVTNLTDVKPDQVTLSLGSVEVRASELSRYQKWKFVWWSARP